jgi:hypothetical protein
VRLQRVGRTDFLASISARIRSDLCHGQHKRYKFPLARILSFPHVPSLRRAWLRWNVR